MARVRFTSNMRRHVECPDGEPVGRTVGEVLAGYFGTHPAVRSYVLDERGSVRRHVTVFVDGTQISDRVALTDTVEPDAEIYVMQALSGGA